MVNVDFSLELHNTFIALFPHFKSSLWYAEAWIYHNVLTTASRKLGDDAQFIKKCQRIIQIIEYLRVCCVFCLKPSRHFLIDMGIRHCQDIFGSNTINPFRTKLSHCLSHFRYPCGLSFTPHPFLWIWKSL